MIAEPIVIASVDAASEEARDLMNALDEELQRRYPGAVIHGLSPEDARDPRVTFFVARVGSQAVGCAALRELDPGTGEVKRMFVRDGYRGRGIARRLIDALRLETGEGQLEAINLYRSAGYTAIPPFGQYAGNSYSRCFEKQLR